MKKLKIEKRHMPDIELVRRLVEYNNTYQDMLVERIAKDMGITSSQEKELLWDHVYNGSDWTIEVVEDAR